MPNYGPPPVIDTVRYDDPADIPEGQWSRHVSRAAQPTFRVKHHFADVTHRFPIAAISIIPGAKKRAYTLMAQGEAPAHLWSL